MSRFVLENCLDVLSTYPNEAIDFVLTDPPYLVNYQDRTGRSIANDKTGEWLEPAFGECFRLLKPDSFCVSFYGWNRVDEFFHAWKKAGFRVVGHLVFTKNYVSKTGVVGYRHESAYVLAKGRPNAPSSPLPDVLKWHYSGNIYHPTEKAVQTLLPLIQSFSRPNDIVLDPFAGSGSTCEAAYVSGRRYIGIELDPKYHAAGLRRLQQVKLNAA
jgi:site-specific DNA-methyltransferase (adenine-specific)